MDYFSVLAPIPDTDFYGVGMGLNLKSGLKIDLAAGFLTGSWRVPNNGSKNLNSTEFIDAVYNPYGGMDVSGSIDATIMAANFSMPFKYLYHIGQVLRKTGHDIKEQLPFLNKSDHPEE
jgi:hypothetical protein